MGLFVRDNAGNVLIYVLISLIVLYLFCVRINANVNNGTCPYRKWERPGSVMIQVIAGIHEPGENPWVSKPVLDQLVALQWMTDIVNGETNYSSQLIPGHTLGYTIYDNCGNNDMTVDLLFSGSMVGQEMICSTPPGTNTTNTPFIIGTISLTTVENTRTVARLVGDMPVVRPLPSSPELRLSNYHNLFQTVVDFQNEAEAIMQLLVHYEWNFIVVIHTDDAYGQKGLETFLNLATYHDICVNYTGLPIPESVTKIYESMTFALHKYITVVYIGEARGAVDLLIAVKHSSNAGPSRPFNSKINWVFTSALEGNINTKDDLSAADNILYVAYEGHRHATNVEFQNYLDDLLETEATVTPIHSILSEYKDTSVHGNDEGLDPRHMIDAVLTLTSAAKQVIESNCPTPDLAECKNGNQELSMMSAIKQTNFNTTHYFVQPDVYPYSSRSITFGEDGLQMFGEMQLLLHTGSNEIASVGSYTSKQIFIPGSPSIPLPTSVCGGYCSSCLENTDIRFSYLPGDVLILGLFSIRQYGDTSFTCGQLRRGTNDIITVSAFMHSVLTKREEQPSIKFGAIAIDDCYSALNASNYLLELFSKHRFLRDPGTLQNINFDDVIAVVGALASSVTLSVADLATSLNLPLISYSASSPELDNHNRYPFFLRTVPSDTLQIQGMIELISELRVTHVGLLYIDNAYGRAGKLGLLEAARNRNICVETPVSVSQDMTDNEVWSVIQTLYDAELRVVLFFSIDSVAQRVLDQLKSKGPNKPLTFISSDGWGTNHHLVTGGLGLRSHGSLIFTVDSRTYIDVAYKRFLENLNATQTEYNRWIPNFFEDFKNCYMKTSYEKYESSPSRPVCNNDQMSVRLNNDTISSLYTDQRAVHVKLSVHALIEGYHQCRQTTLCSTKNAKELIDSIRTVKIEGAFIFDDAGNGNIGYIINNIQEDTSQTFKYVKVGSFNKEELLKMTSQPKFYNTLHNEVSLESTDYAYYIDCLNYLDTCSDVCKFPSTTSSITDSSAASIATVAPVEPKSDLMTVAVILGVLFAVMLVVLLVLVYVIVRLYRKQEKRMSELSGSATGFSSSGSGDHEVYDVPSNNMSSHHFNNLAFVNDSASVHSRSHTPTSHHDMSYLDPRVQHMDGRHGHEFNPRIGHARQRSHQELATGQFYSLERPPSALSAPGGVSTPGRRRYNKQKVSHLHKYSPKTPNSVPITFSNQTTAYRPQNASSLQRFRYGSTQSEESHYNLPDDGSPESLARQRRHGVSDDNIHKSQDDFNQPGNKFLLYPKDEQSDTEGESNGNPITYLTANDLVHNTSDEEEDAGCDSDDGSVNAAPKIVPVASKRITSSTSVISPTDIEVMEINYSASQSDKQSFTQPRTHSSTNMDSGGSQKEIRSIRLSGNEGNKQAVPDIIKHGQYEEDGVFLI